MQGLLIDASFALSFLFSVPFWALMLILPHHPLTMRLMDTYHPLLPLSSLYVILLLIMGPQLLSEGLPLSLQALSGLMASPGAFLILWCHMGLLDLFLGRWIYMDSLERGTRGYSRSFSLLLAMLMGPAGFMSHLALRGRRDRVIRTRPMRIQT